MVSGAGLSCDVAAVKRVPPPARNRCRQPPPPDPHPALVNLGLHFRHRCVILDNDS